MGWLFMPSLRRFNTPKQYLENQFTYEGETKTSTVVASAIVRMRTWYAACSQIDKPTGNAEISAIVCLIRYNAHARDGMIFGYKEISEFMRPCEAECPASILDLLGQTDNKHALAWRQRCRDQRAKQARPSPRHGDLVVFADAISFTDGFTGNRFYFVTSKRGSYFTQPEGSGGYRIRNWRTVAWTIVPTIALRPIAA